MIGGSTIAARETENNDRSSGRGQGEEGRITARTRKSRKDRRNP